MQWLASITLTIHLNIKLLKTEKHQQVSLCLSIACSKANDNFVFFTHQSITHWKFCNLKTLRNHVLLEIFYTDSCNTLSFENLSTKTKLLCPSLYLRFVVNFPRLLCCCANSYLPLIHLSICFLLFQLWQHMKRHLSGLHDGIKQLAYLCWCACLVSRDDLLWQLRVNSTRKLNTLQHISSCEISCTYNLPSY